MRLLSGLGYSPQVYVLCGLIMIFLFVIGLRWEATMALFAVAGVLTLGAIVKLIVERPRPSGEVAKVLNPISGYSFPSGHTLLYTAFIGFLWFLIYTLAPHSLRRTLGLFVLGGMVALIGVSRVYLGEHWPSDVLAAYLLGSVWLALTIYAYRWGKPRFFATQPVAPEKPQREVPTTS
jgi:undecaprenyl-diphosphatase